MTLKSNRTILVFAAMTVLAGSAGFCEPSRTPDKQIGQLLEANCFDCHGDGMEKGGLALDRYKTDPSFLRDTTTWLAVWRKLDADLMPPPKKSRLSAEDRHELQNWIIREVFSLDPARPEPGKPTVRRLNRIEYQHTIRDWLGVNYSTADNFPPDDTGYGFDNIGDVLSISPLLMEKYLNAAQDIAEDFLEKARPKIPAQTFGGEQFTETNDGGQNGRQLAFARPATAIRPLKSETPGRYKITLEFRVTGSEDATTETANLSLMLNGVELKKQSVGWDNRRVIMLSAIAELTNRTNELGMRITPGNPPLEDENHLALSVAQVRVQGPLDGSKLFYPPEYRRLLPEGAPPEDPKLREQYAKRILRPMADKAFRQPVDDSTLNRLLELTMAADRQPGVSFEQALGLALTAMLASPRFLFHAEQLPAQPAKGKAAPISEFALASRLSYLLWSSLPDDELFALARTNGLRANLNAQVDRMLADRRSDRFVESFVGQWLQVRDVNSVVPDPKRILGLKSYAVQGAFFATKLRSAMKQETELFFADLLRNDGTLTDLLTARESYLNSTLAALYGVPGVKGDQMRKVTFPTNLPRAGILTHGSVLLVTSNPTRTSPVKRGLFILDNLLGTPPPPPPPNVPALEQAKKELGKTVTMRELMVAHRENPMCASCHERMDPLGLAFEHYNALGGFRDNENGQPIDTKGTLITGEEFKDAAQLADILTTSRRHDLYRCVTEKLLTYALGRGVEYYDLPTVMDIVDQLERDNGKLKTLVLAVVNSAPFQMQQAEPVREARARTASQVN